ncbi:hypothetical protein GCK72_021577 [Caenorhabditis remanei]|uniref:Uncharacterized protein n=1 Tax=Caenorhabditis remanei TaxID=31234 RepID=A0A6A5GIJ4_CAERE|nr:hypothetical protein GCK72_021577 [Caenorhabditis remanei]KAF1755010.1 hypothetical protein GCK72_021577 [Caenorhabditis remanei]
MSQPLKCIECGVQPIRLLKMGPTMPEQVKEMFTPIHEDIQKITKDLGRSITFQARQRANLFMGLTKKERHFDRLREAHNEQKAKKDNYKKQLETAYELLQAKDLEISALKSSLTVAQQATPLFTQAPPPPQPSMKSADTMTTPSMIRIFSDSMYNRTPKSDKTEKKKRISEIPAFLRFTTPANPPHMFPHLAKLEAAKKSAQHSQ